MSQKIIFLIVTLCLSYSVSEHISLIGSNFLPIETDYKVYLNAHDLGPDSVINVTLESGQGYESFKVYEDFSNDLSEDVQFKIPNNLPSTFKLSIIHKNKITNACTKQSLRISDNINRKIIFLQLNKPVYKNDDTIKFRSFLVNHKMLPIQNANLNVKIFDGSGKIIQNFVNVKTSKLGIYENSVKISDMANFGRWKVQVDAEGKSTSKVFQVLQHDSEDFQVLITSLDKEVAFDAKYVFLNIKVKHQCDKIFTGIVRIASTAKDTRGQNIVVKRTLQDIVLPLADTVVPIHIENNLGIRFPSSDMVIAFDIEVIEDKTQRSQKLTLKIPLRHKGRNNFLVFRNPYFKPGFDFPMIVQIKDLNGDPDDSLNLLKVVIDYEELNPDTHVPTTDKKTYQIVPNKGEVELMLKPTVNTRQIKVYLEIADTELMEVIKSIKSIGVDEYMNVTVWNDEYFNVLPKTLQLTAKSSSHLETLHVLVFGSDGLIYSKKYPEAEHTEEFKFNLELTEEMSPKCMVLVYYIRKIDGLIVFDEFPLGFKFSWENTLNLAPDQNVKPNSMVSLKFKDSPVGSTVFLSAIDLNYELVNTRNEIIQSNMYAEAVQYMNERYNNVSAYQFNRFNAFVMEPLVSGRSCDEDIEIIPKEVINESNMEDFNQKYFPDVWFDDVIESKANGVQTIQKALSDSFTSWRIVGVSMHPTKGLAISNYPRHVRIKPEIALKIYSPAFIHENEVLKVEFSVFNFLQNPQTSQITIEIENGDLMTEKSKKRWFSNIWCKSYIHKNKKQDQFTLQLPSTSMSALNNFFIQPTNLGEMKIKFIAKAGDAEDKVEKVINVLDRKRFGQTPHKNFLMTLKTNELSNFKLELTIDVKMIAMGMSGTNLAVIEVLMPSGYEYYGYTENENVVKSEIKNNRALAIFHVNLNATTKMQRIVIQAVKVYQIEKCAKSSIKAYVLNRPDVSDEIEYDFDKNTKQCS